MSVAANILGGLLACTCTSPAAAPASAARPTGTAVKQWVEAGPKTQGKHAGVLFVQVYPHEALEPDSECTLRRGAWGS